MSFWRDVSKEEIWRLLESPKAPKNLPEFHQQELATKHVITVAIRAWQWLCWCCSSSVGRPFTSSASWPSWSGRASGRPRPSSSRAPSSISLETEAFHLRNIYRNMCTHFVYCVPSLISQIEKLALRLVCEYSSKSFLKFDLQRFSWRVYIFHTPI